MMSRISRHQSQPQYRERVGTCMNYNNTMRVNKCECIFNCVLLFENISLLLPADVVSQYFQEDVMKLYERDEMQMLWFLENVDYTYNSKNNLITKMSDHLNQGRNFIHFLEIFIFQQDIFCSMKPEVAHFYSQFFPGFKFA